MSFYSALAPLTALACTEALRRYGFAESQVMWPQTVAIHEVAIVSVTARGGYDDDGIYAELTCVVSELALADDFKSRMHEIYEAIAQRIESYSRSIEAGTSVAGPFAQFLNDYFDVLALVDEQVVATNRQGQLAAAGRLAGMDVWGHVLIVDDKGQEHAVSSEQVVVSRS